MDSLLKLKQLFEIESSKQDKDFDKLTNIATLIKTLSEGEKLKAEVDKISTEKQATEKQLKSKSQSYISLLAPILTAATLLFTIYQFNKNNEQQRISNEETQWREFSKQLQNRTTFNNNLTIPASLISFMESDRFSNQAREVAFTILPDFVDADKFEYLFSKANTNTNFSNFGRLSRLSKNLTKIYFISEEEKRKSQAKLDDSSAVVKILAKENLKRDSTFNLEIDKELTLVANAMVDFIKHNQRRSLTMLQLKGAFFFKNDLANLNFSNSDISETRIMNCDVSSANFENILLFEGSKWDNTVWWNAKKIDSNLVKYLIENYPYKSGVDYFNGAKTDSISYLKLVNGYK